MNSDYEEIATTNALMSLPVGSVIETEDGRIYQKLDSDTFKPAGINLLWCTAEMMHMGPYRLVLDEVGS